jgi:hypothetical protein
MWWLTLSPPPEVRDRPGLVAGSVSTVSDGPETTAGKEPFFGVTCRRNETGRSSFPGAARRLAQMISGDVLRGRLDFDPAVEDGQNLDPGGEGGQNPDPAVEDDQNLDRGLGGG